MSNLTPGDMAEAMQTFAAGLVTELDDLKAELGSVDLALGTMKLTAETATAMLVWQRQIEDSAPPINTDRDAAEANGKLDRIRLAVQPIADGACYLTPGESKAFARDILKIAGES